MSDLPDLREQIAALFRSAPGETRLGDEPPGLIADAVLGVLPEGWDRFVRTIQVLRDQVAAAEASRRDWAAEAMCLEMAWGASRCTGAHDCHSDVHHEGCFYSDTDSPEHPVSSVHPEGGGS